MKELVPHLFITFSSHCCLFFTPVRSFFPIFLVRRRRKLLIHLLCNQLRNRAWFSEKDKKRMIKCVTQYDHKGEAEGLTMAHPDH